MAIQRLGSSLIAKSQSGSRLRSAEEDRQTGALQRGADSAQIGSPVRGSVDEPINKLEPQGTQKVVSVQPSITPTEKSVVSRVGIAPSLGAASRINNPSSGGGKASNPGGGATPASRTAFQPAKASGSVGGIGRPALSYAPGGGGAKGAVLGSSTKSQGSPVRVKNPVQLQSQGLVKSLTGLGNRVSAGELTIKPVVFKPTTAIRGAVGKAIDKVGRALGNPLPEKRISENLQSATLAQVKKAPRAGKGIAKAIKSAPSTLRSTVRSTVKKASSAAKSVIRSLTKRK